MTHLYQTKAVNEDGVSGQSYIKGDQPIKVTSPLSQEKGSNPEKLIGLSLSTCFNSTIQAILKEEGLDSKTKTEVTVELHSEEDGPGYYFTLHTELSIEGMAVGEVKEYLAKTKSRCPMSKLLKDTTKITYAVSEYN